MLKIFIQEMTQYKNIADKRSFTCYENMNALVGLVFEDSHALLGKHSLHAPLNVCVLMEQHNFRWES
jgi:hypothetical protein